MKYNYKGADQAIFQLREGVIEDEISNYINARYICSTEAAWRIFEMLLHERYPTVVQLAMRLDNGQRLYFLHTYSSTSSSRRSAKNKP